MFPRLFSVVMTVTPLETGQPVNSEFKKLISSSPDIEDHAPIAKAKSPTPTTRESPNATNILLG